MAVLWKFIDSDHSGAISSQELTTFLIRCEREVERTDTRRAERDRRKNRPKKAPKKAKKVRPLLLLLRLLLLRYACEPPNTHPYS